jgi:deferrochelatase/peroxidase EfeB
MKVIPHVRDFKRQDQENARLLILAGLGEHFGFVDETINPDIEDIEKNYIAKKISL